MKQPMLLKVIEINMGADKTVTNPIYNMYFKQKNALDGVRSVLKAGKFIINGFPIPGSSEEFLRLYKDGYMLNRSPWLVKTETGYRVGQNDFSDYSDAAMEAATGFIAGLEVRLMDNDGDSFADRIEMDYVEAVIPAAIRQNEDETYSLFRAEPDPSSVWENDGRVFDGKRFTKGSGEKILPKNLDPSIKKGDVVLFRYTPGGWVVRRAKEIRGRLTGGEDHRYYQLDMTRYEDAMRFSRDNLPISNRCGEYLNTHKYFGFTDGDKEISLWSVHTSDPSLQGAPAGFTSGANAAVFLSKAVDAARAKLRTAAGASTADAAFLSKAICRAERALSEVSDSEILDYNTYLLYLALHGSGDDIGARFAGFEYPGFN